MKVPVLGIALFGVIVGILLMLTGIWLFKSQKKNRKFDKKVTRWYTFIVFLFFALVGLWGLHPQKSAFGIFLAIQVCFLSLGGLHLWVLFSYFEWPDRNHFLGESLLTLYTFLSGLLGFFICFKLLDRFAGPNRGFEFWYVRGAIWYLIPYLMVRTYDLLMLIPPKEFYTWRFIPGCSPNLNLQDSNIFRISIQLQRGYTAKQEPWIDQKPRYPKDANFAEFFLRFVSDYNKRHPEAPIENLTEDTQGNKIGWNFKVRKFSTRRRFLLDPKEYHSQVLSNEDTVIAYRVPLSEDHPEPEPCPEKGSISEIEFFSPGERSSSHTTIEKSDDGIQFFE